MSLNLCVCGHVKMVHDSMGCRKCSRTYFDDICTKYLPFPPVTLGPVDALVETVDNTDAEIKAAIDEAAEGLV